MAASQALSHPWIRDAQQVKIPLDMIIYKLIRGYISSSSLWKSALRALANTLTANQLFYLKEQFELLGPNKSGYISLQNLKSALGKNSTDAMKDSRVIDFVNTVSFLSLLSGHLRRGGVVDVRCRKRPLWLDGVHAQPRRPLSTASATTFLVFLLFYYGPVSVFLLPLRRGAARSIPRWRGRPRG